MVAIANAIFVVAAVYSAGVAVYVFAQYGAPGDMRQLGLAVVPAAVSGLLLLALRMRPAWRVRVAAAMVSTSVSLWGLELVSGWVLSVDPLDTFSLRTEGFDRRTRSEVVEGLRRDGVKAYPSIIPKELLYEIDGGVVRSRIALGNTEVVPLGGIAAVPTVFCNESGAYVVYRSGEQGFHNPPGPWPPPPIDVLALGDSFTHGACVSSEQNMVSRLRQRYARVVNLGMAGNGPLIMLAGLREYGTALRPKHVIWFYFEGNDLNADLLGERKSPVLRRYLEDGFQQGLLSRQGAVDAQLVAYVDRAMAVADTPAPTLRLDNFVLLRTLRNITGWTYGPSEEDVDLFAEILRQAQAATASWGGQLHFVYLPIWNSVVPPRSAYFRSMDERVTAVVEGLHIPSLDMYEVFQRQHNHEGLFVYPRSHYGAEGYRVVAEAVLEHLNR
jgi:hypothetical protein